VIQTLLKLRDLLGEALLRWAWELEQAEVKRREGDDQHFLRAKAGYRNTQEALALVEIELGNQTGWPDLFPHQPPFSVQAGENDE
jgi:hypothetical protein